MSLATRCTQCGTIFRVVQDQLKVSEGWVRCGRCREVFNALEGLFDLDREAPPQRTPATTPTATEVAARGMAEFVASHYPKPNFEADPLPVPDEPAALPTADVSGLSSGTPADEEEDFKDARFFPSDLPLDAAVDESTLSPSSAALPFEDEENLPPGPTSPGLAPLRRARETTPGTLRSIPADFDAVPPERALALRPEPAPATHAPGFLRQADAAARWRRPRVRASLVVLGLLLAGVLAAQVGVQFRDLLAAQHPAARPALQTLCELLGCSIAPPRRLAALTVEASGLTQAEGSDAYRLSLHLLNRDTIEVAAPSVELSLTDLSGALIARRALRPSDFRTAADARPVAPSVPGGSEAQWQLLLGTGGQRISGYTVELFYP